MSLVDWLRKRFERHGAGTIYFQSWSPSAGEVHHRQRRGLASRLLIFASGADPVLLDYVPEEERKYRKLGALIFLTTGLAFFSGTIWVSSNLGIEPTGQSALLGGLLVAILVFVIDRALVIMPTSAFEFPKRQSGQLGGSDSYPTLFVRLARSAESGIGALSGKRVAKAAVGLLLRLSLALVLSLMIAETVAVRVFEDRIDDRIAAEVPLLRAERISQIESLYDPLIEASEDRVAELTASLEGPSVETVEAEVEALQSRLLLCQGDIATISLAVTAERTGEVATFTLSEVNDVAQIQTSGDGGRGEAWETLLALRDTIESKCQSIQTSIDEAQSALQSPPAPSAADLATTELISDERTLLASYQKDKSREIESLDIDANSSGDFLSRRRVLEDLSLDADPTTVEFDEVEGRCESGLRCQLVLFFRPGTPIGNWVGLLRAFLLIVDLMPVIYKFALTVRRRRPYDALVAAIEERHYALSLDLVDNVYNEVAENRAMRTAMREMRDVGEEAGEISSTSSEEREEHYGGARDDRRPSDQTDRDSSTTIENAIIDLRGKDEVADSPSIRGQLSTHRMQGPGRDAQLHRMERQSSERTATRAPTPPEDRSLTHPRGSRRLGGSLPTTPDGEQATAPGVADASPSASSGRTGAASSTPPLDRAERPPGPLRRNDTDRGSRRDTRPTPDTTTTGGGPPSSGHGDTHLGSHGESPDWAARPARRRERRAMPSAERRVPAESGSEPELQRPFTLDDEP